MRILNFHIFTFARDLQERDTLSNLSGHRLVGDGN